MKYRFTVKGKTMEIEQSLINTSKATIKVGEGDTLENAQIIEMDSRSLFDLIGVAHTLKAKMKEVQNA